MSSHNSIISEKQKLLLQIEELKKKIALTQDKINIINKKETEIPVLECIVSKSENTIFDTDEYFDENISKITSSSRNTTSKNENVKGFKRLMKKLNERKQFNNIKELIVSQDTVVSVFDENEKEIEICGFKTSKIKSEPLSKSTDKKSLSKSINFNKLSEKQQKNVSELFNGLKRFSKIQNSDSNKKSEK